MKNILLLLSFVFSLSLSAQRFNSVDTSYSFTYEQALELAKDREKRKRLEREIELLIKIGVEKDYIIDKLKLRDSLYTLEIKKCDELNDLLWDKNERYSEIIDNYRILLLSAEDRLKAETNKKKREELWKNIYKYGIPAAAIVAVILIK
jgi:hypothetical protein